jgi:hypothetical protein
MNRTQMMAVRWMRASAVPVVQSKCALCQMRAFSSGQRLFNDEKAQQQEGASTSTGPATKAVKEKTALEELFDSPDAFQRDDVASTFTRKAQSPTGSNQNTVVPRAILGGTLDNTNDLYASQLNQEWEGESGNRGNASPLPFDSKSNFRSDYRMKRRPKDNYRGLMTPKETKTFSLVFDSIFGADGQSERKVEEVDDGLFGSTLEYGHNENLSDYRERTMRNWDDQKKKKEFKKRSTAALLSEGIVVESINQEELERMIDQAREEIVACQSVADTWQWAAKNVWDSDHEEQLENDMFRLAAAEEAQEQGNSQEEGNVVGEEKDDSIAAEEEEAPDSLRSVQEVKGARFGIKTPYYAPVLNILLGQLRERFKSPQSALSILRVTKNLGPDSFVLGCTPQLYAQALRTRWQILRDLQGARDTLQEARDTGILGVRSLLTEAWDNRASSRRSGPENEEDVVRGIVNNVIRAEVRQHVVEGMSRLPAGETSQAYEHQLGLSEEMHRLVATSRSSSRRF